MTSKRVLNPAEIEAGYREFQKELLVDHYDKAKEIVDQKRLDRFKVVSILVETIWQKLIVTKEVTVSGADFALEKFKVNKAVKDAFAVKAFDFYVVSNFCEMAGDVVVVFNMDQAYAEKAVRCVEVTDELNYSIMARIVCRMSDFKDLQSKFVTGWVEKFKNTAPTLREYFSWWRAKKVDEYASILKVVDKCLLTEDQYLDLFMIGIQDKKPEFVKAILEKEGFKKTPAHYKEFIDMAVEQYQCAMAASMALKNKLPDQVVEKVFLSRKCQGGNLGEVEVKLVPPKNAEWFFNLSLKAQEFLLARKTIKEFSLGKDSFDKAVEEGMKVNDYGEVLLFEPWDKERAEDFRDGILNKMLDANEEWPIIRFLGDHSSGGTELKLFSDTQKAGWTERAFLHALRRGAYDLAADISSTDKRSDFKDWGIRLSFDEAMKARNPDMAKLIAKVHHLDKDKDIMRRVAMLYFEKNQEKERQKIKDEAIKKKRECEASQAKDKDWHEERCK